MRPELRDALADAMIAVLPISDVSADLTPPEPPQLAAALRAYPRAGVYACVSLLVFICVQTFTQVWLHVT